MAIRNLITVCLLLAGLTVVALVGCNKSEQKPAAQTPSAPPAAAAFANERCPIMQNNPINPENVPADLVREFQGKKVAFCCAGCPGKWDAMTDAEKAAALAAVAKKP
jgi:hypothetical protein